jgi:nicotinamidase/pyrazinamidase
MKTLILVDLQNDFLPGGALAVPRGDAVVPVANHVQRHFELVLATQDWHPPDHGSFAANHPGKKVGDVIELDGISQILWPVHCVRNTPGADFAPGFDRGRVAEVFRKGVDTNIDSYSAFFDNGHRRGTGLADYLAERGVKDIHLLGLATDYCVKFTALDGRELGLGVHVIADGCRGVNLKPGDDQKALEEMRERGVVVVYSHELEKEQ